MAQKHARCQVLLKLFLISPSITRSTNFSDLADIIFALLILNDKPTGMMNRKANEECSCLSIKALLKLMSVIVQAHDHGALTLSVCVLSESSFPRCFLFRSRGVFHFLPVLPQSWSGFLHVFQLYEIDCV